MTEQTKAVAAVRRVSAALAVRRVAWYSHSLFPRILHVAAGRQQIRGVLDRTEPRKGA